MHTLIYISSAARDFKVGELCAMLTDFRRNNAILGITGILLYQDLTFMQVLEGEADVVRTLFSRIAMDPRHKSVITLMDEEISERAFPEWSMAFPDHSSPGVRDLPGFNDFLQTSWRDTALLDPSKAMLLLLTFRCLLVKQGCDRG